MCWKYTVVFSLLKEIGAMPIELNRVTLRDIDFERETITIRGRKGHASRTTKLKPSVMAMLRTYLARIKDKERLFPASTQMTKAWIKYRKRLANKLEELEPNEIRLYDPRHFKACMTYHRTKDVFYTKEIMGWKKLKTALFYPQNLSFGSDEFHVVIARNVSEACRLIEAGFQYVTEMDGVKLFRKKKMTSLSAYFSVPIVYRILSPNPPEPLTIRDHGPHKISIDEMNFIRKDRDLWLSALYS